MGRGPVPLTREAKGLRRGNLLGRVEGRGRLKAASMSHIKHDSLKATYLGGGRHFGMIWIVEGEKEARYGNVRQDERWGWRTRGRHWEGIKTKAQDAD